MAKTVLIIGGGIGGLAAAVALTQRGCEVRVFEQAPELREIGAGLSVWANATRVLEQLGLLPEVLDQGEVLERLQLRSWEGSVLCDIRTVGSLPTPSVCMHRADLLAILRQRVPFDALRLGARFESVQDRNGVVIAGFADGRQADGLALVGADGLNSTVRQQVQGPARLAYRGYWACRGIARFALPTPYTHAATETWGHGQRFGMEPMGHGRVFWYATANAPRGPLGAQSEWKDDLRERFKEWCSPIPELLEATPSDAILKHEMLDRKPVRQWGVGRVTLLGDAAHPTTPNLGQGACLAIEDAAVLARCLGAHDQVEAGLRAYESLRFRRTRFITRESRRIGWIGQLEGRLAVALRSLWLRMLPRFVMDRRHRSYYSFEA